MYRASLLSFRRPPTTSWNGARRDRSGGGRRWEQGVCVCVLMSMHVCVNVHACGVCLKKKQTKTHSYIFGLLCLHHYVLFAWVIDDHGWGTTLALIQAGDGCAIYPAHLAENMKLAVDLPKLWVHMWSHDPNCL